MTEGTYILPVMETVKTAWAKVSGAKGSLWAVIGIFLLVQIVLEICGGIGAKGLFNFIGWLVQIIAGASLIYLGIKRAQDTPISYKMAKDVLNARIILYIIGLYILQILIFIPAGIVAGIGVFLSHMQSEPSTAMHLVSALFYLAAVAIFIFLSARLWLGYGAIVDKKLNPWEAVKLSFKTTQGNVWNLIGLYIINIFIIIVCLITIGIGFIWGIPWLMIIYGEAYKRLSSRQDIRPIG